jgi:hypothetical protein
MYLVKITNQELMTRLDHSQKLPTSNKRIDPLSRRTLHEQNYLVRGKKGVLLFAAVSSAVAPRPPAKERFYVVIWCLDNDNILGWEQRMCTFHPTLESAAQQAKRTASTYLEEER